jgi:hypothetical protein
MNKKLIKNDFIHCDALRGYFSHNGLVALYEYFEEYEESCGTELEFNPVAIRCDFTEWEDIGQIVGYYDEMQLVHHSDVKRLQWLRDRTQVIVFETGIILQDF